MPCNAGYEWCKKHAADKEYEGKKYCLFHSPEDKSPFNVDGFNELIFREINTAIKENRHCDLSGTIFPGDISFRQYTKEQPLPSISFLKAQFSGKADFSVAQFGSDAIFVRALFPCEADFRSAKFSGKANFESIRFSGEAHFGYARFSGVANFTYTQFKERANFKKAFFENSVDFRTARIKFADFAESMFKQPVFFNRLFIDGQGKVRFHNVNMEKASFRGTDLRLCDFITCEWKEKDGRYILYDEEEYREEWNHRIFKPDERVSRIKDIENLYRTLKQETKAKHDEFSYSRWHYSEKEMQLERTTLKENPFYYLALHFYKWSSGFGEEPKRAGGWLIGLILLATILLGISGVKPVDGGADCSRGLPCAVYLQNDPSMFGKVLVTTFEHLMFKSATYFKPATVTGNLLKIVFQLLIYLQATLFGFALRNRFRR